MKFQAKPGHTFDQAWLDQVREALIRTCAQGRRAMRPNGIGCAYNDTTNGGHCAVGHLGVIRGCVDSLTEASGLSSQYVETHLMLGATSESHVDLLSCMQQAHDGAHERDRTIRSSCGERKTHVTFIRPFGMSWGEWVWYRAAVFMADFVTIGPYPRREVQAYADR